MFDLLAVLSNAKGLHLTRYSLIGVMQLPYVNCSIRFSFIIHITSGHTVTGVEGVPFVVEQFFRENKLEYEKVCQVCVVPDRNELFG